MIDIKRVKKTKGGYEVRIYATDGGGKYPFHGAVFYGGEWLVCTWTDCGDASPKICFGRDFDLIEEPRTVEIDFWVNVNSDGGTVGSFRSRERADVCSRNNRFACINIKRTVTEGEGL